MPGVTGVTTRTDGTGFMTGAPAATSEPPQLEQKTASSLLLYPHEGHRLTNILSSSFDSLSRCAWENGLKRLVKTVNEWRIHKPLLDYCRQDRGRRHHVLVILERQNSRKMSTNVTGRSLSKLY